jgi:hypothetical protein
VFRNYYFSINFFLLFNNFFEVKPQLDQNSMRMGDLTRGLIYLGPTASELTCSFEILNLIFLNLLEIK